jgi:hypothetical protein
MSPHTTADNPMQSLVAGRRQLLAEKSAWLALLIIPTVVVVIPLVFKGNLGPYYLGMRSDPTYVYLFSSLVITCGHIPPYMDHPGTPLEFLGAAIIAIKTSLQGRRFCPIDQVLTQPELFLNWIENFLLVLLATGCFIFSARIFRLTSDIYAALAAQVALLGSATLVVALNQPAPEILLIATTFVLGFCLAPVIFESEKKPRRTVLLSGAVVGFGLATKITLFPFLLYALFFKDLKAKATFVLATAAAFVFFTLPIVPNYLNFARWIKQIAIHSEKYGSGPVGLPSASTLADNGLTIIGAEPLAFAMAAASLLLVGFIYLRARNPRLEGASRFILLTQATLVVQLLMTMKHFELRYMVPALAASAVSGSIALAAIGAVRPRLSAFGFVVVLAIAAPQMAMNLNHYMTDSYATDRIENDKLVEMGSETCARIIPYYRSSSQPYALFFGNAFVGGLGGPFAADLARLYPNFMSYNVWFHDFETFSASYNASELAGVPHSKSFCLSGTTELPYRGHPNSWTPPNVRFIGKQGDIKLYELLQK